MRSSLPFFCLKKAIGSPKKEKKKNSDWGGKKKVIYKTKNSLLFGWKSRFGVLKISDFRQKVQMVRTASFPVEGWVFLRTNKKIHLACLPSFCPVQKNTLRSRILSKHSKIWVFATIFVQFYPKNIQNISLSIYLTGSKNKIFCNFGRNLK